MSAASARARAPLFHRAPGKLAHLLQPGAPINIQRKPPLAPAKRAREFKTDRNQRARLAIN